MNSQPMHNQTVNTQKTKSNSTYKGPLAGLNVIDFGHYFAGPMAGMLLADQGANVIRVVRPGVPEVKQQQYRLLNRQKKLLTLDLKTPEGKATAEALIKRADVLIENFRPGVMKRLGLDYASLKAINPRLVYLSLPGFASSDKERAHLQAWEGIMGAAIGMFTMVSEIRRQWRMPPVYTWVPLCSSYGAMNGAAAVMAALIAREKHGIGTVIEVPLVDAGLTAFEADFMLKGSNPQNPLRQWPAPPSSRKKEKSEAPSDFFKPENRKAMQETLAKATEQRLFKTYAFHIYKCADNRGLMVTANSWKFFDILGISQQVKNAGYVIESAWEQGPGNNATGYMTDERKARLMEMIGTALKTRTAEEWEELLTREGGGLGTMVRTREEWLALESHIESGFHVNLYNGATTLRVPGRLAGISGPDNTVIIPEIQEAEIINSAQAIALFGEAPDSESDSVNPDSVKCATTHDIPPLKKSDLLKGLRVLDMANVVAGPGIAWHLAEYGAEVIRSDPPKPSHYSPGIHAMVLLMNKGKRLVLNDLTTEPGREVFQKLVQWADVVTHNCVDGTAERLGVSHPQLRKLNAEIVTCQLSAFGGPYRGGWGMRRGAEQDVQCGTGLMASYGTLENPQRHSIIGIGDVPAGFGGLFTCLLGVYQKARTGYGGECRTSLAQVGNYVQLPYMISENGNAYWGEAHGQFTQGPDCLQRMYECKDGWLYVGATENNAAVLTETVLTETVLTDTALTKTVSDNESAQTEMLEQAFYQQGCAHWQTALQQNGIACHKVTSVEDILKETGVRYVDNQATDEMAEGGAEVLCWADHPCGFPVIMPAADYVRIGENHSWYRLAPAERIGAHTRKVMEELGYNAASIDWLMRIRAVHDYFPPLGSTKGHLFPVRKQA